MSDEQKEK